MACMKLDTLTPDPSLSKLLSGARHRRRAPLVITVLVLLGLGGTGLWWFRQDAPVWESAPVREGVLVETITAVGTLEPRVSVEVGSRLTGQVAEVLVAVNDAVTAGQLLATLEETPFRNAVDRAVATVASARAQLEEASANLADALRDLARSERLVARGAATRVDVEDAATRVATAHAAVAAGRAQVEQAAANQRDAEEDLGKAEIRAPIAGVVTRRLVEPGQTVVSAMSATALFEIASDLRDLEVEVDVDEADVPHVAVGQAAGFTVPAWPTRTFTGAVATVDVAPDEGADVVTYRAVLTVPNDDLALRPGMTVTAAVEVARHEGALLIPSSALRFRPSTAPAAEAQQVGDAVWVQSAEEVRRVEVTVRASHGGTTAVSGALEPGDTVLVGEEGT